MFNEKNRKLALSRKRSKEQVLVCNLRAMKSNKDTHFNCHCQEEADEAERKRQEEERVRKEEERVRKEEDRVRKEEQRVRKEELDR